MGEMVDLVVVMPRQAWHGLGARGGQVTREMAGYVSRRAVAQVEAFVRAAAADHAASEGGGEGGGGGRGVEHDEQEWDGKMWYDLVACWACGWGVGVGRVAGGGEVPNEDLIRRLAALPFHLAGAASRFGGACMEGEALCGGDAGGAWRVGGAWRMGGWDEGNVVDVECVVERGLVCALNYGAARREAGCEGAGCEGAYGRAMCIGETRENVDFEALLSWVQLAAPDADLIDVVALVFVPLIG